MYHGEKAKKRKISGSVALPASSLNIGLATHLPLRSVAKAWRKHPSSASVT